MAKKTSRQVVDIEADTQVNEYAGLAIKPGDQVYLSTKSSPDLKIGNITLSAYGKGEQRNTTIPEDVSLNDLYKWNRAYKLKVILKGNLEFDNEGNLIEKRVSKPQYNNRNERVLDYCIGCLTDSTRLRDMVVGISSAGTHISGWNPKELLSEVRKHESNHLNRHKILDILDRMIDGIGHISFVDEEFDERKHAKADVNYDLRIYTKKK